MPSNDGGADIGGFLEGRVDFVEVRNSDDDDPNKEADLSVEDGEMYVSWVRWGRHVSISSCVGGRSGGLQPITLVIAYDRVQSI